MLPYKGGPAFYLGAVIEISSRAHIICYLFMIITVSFSILNYARICIEKNLLTGILIMGAIKYCSYSYLCVIKMGYMTSKDAEDGL